MLPPKKPQSAEQRELARLFNQLDAAGRQSLLDFARFLAQRPPPEPALEEAPQPLQPQHIPRPAEESVVAAIRRLAQTYPMLNKDELLHQSSNLMSGHVLHGRSAVEVIDELEALFADAYGRYAAANSHQQS